MASSIEILTLAKQAFYDNKPTALLFNTGNSISIPNNSFAGVPWNNSTDDNWSGHSNVTNTSRYTAQVAGLYRFAGTVALAASTTGYRLTGWGLNGAEIANSRYYFPAPSGTVISSAVAATTKLRLNVGDYVELFYYQNSGGPLNTTSGSWMDVEFVHF